MLDRYWPRQEEIDRCIKAEAETAFEAVLLAVHQPMPLRVRNAGSQLETPATELNVLETFLTPNLPEGTLLLAVTGASGAGKSHLIRWLAAQLRRDDRAKRMLIIRIPKSASLRSVVDLILEPLTGDERYANARMELHQAVAEVTPEIGAIRLVGGLEIALNELDRRLTSELRTDPQAPNRRDLKRGWTMLAAYHPFSTTPHYRSISSRTFWPGSSSGLSEATTDCSMTCPCPSSRPRIFRVPDDIDLGRASLQVRQYYQTVLNHDGGKGFERAAEVLNEVLDQAICEVFRLGQAMGGGTPLRRLSCKFGSSSLRTVANSSS